jgi:hypothetical protein
MKNVRLGLLAIPLMVFILGSPASAADSSAVTTCKDGTTSTATGRGACSGHGGVQKAAAGSATSGAAPAHAAPTHEAPAVAAPATPAVPAGPAASGPSTCKDGTTSMATGRGACSGHGGVQKPSKSKPTAEGTAAAPAVAAAGPAGSTAKCKDGTYSKSQHHAGTCSHHGGVAEWLAPQ